LCVESSAVSRLLSLLWAASGPAVQLPWLRLRGLPVLCDFHQTRQKLYIRGAGEPNTVKQCDYYHPTNIKVLIHLCNFDRMRGTNDRASAVFIQKFDALDHGKKKR